ncbi:MAG: nucleoside monophosphate kinase [Candidatus Kerfeldbacteria bacterium]|nr:nucleoside monophosphate kinase [Candidatus Kerfeldbacteria bacterium]
MPESDPKKIILFGPQGSGKGTQAERLSAFFGIPHIYPGNIFRQEIAQQSEIGQQIEEIYNAGKLMPNELTNWVVKKELEKEDAVNGFVIDGYPRNEDQANAMDAMATVTHALLIDIPESESIRRLSQRRSCTNCNITYHLEFKPPKSANRCDVCGRELIQRPDDTPEGIKQRLTIYHQETEPLLARYEQRGVLHRIDGVGSIDDVWQRVLAALA